MATLFDPMAATILAVVCDGRGEDGTRGADAQRCAIPAGRFRRTVGEGKAWRSNRLDDPLRSPQYPIESFDQAVQVRWLSDGDEPGKGNPQEMPQQCRATFALEIGLIYHEQAARFVQESGSETEAGAVSPLALRARGLNAQRRVKRALEQDELVQTTGDDPFISGIVREGSATIEDLGKGRALAVATYTLYYELSLTEDYDP